MRAQWTRLRSGRCVSSCLRAPHCTSDQRTTHHHHHRCKVTPACHLCRRSWRSDGNSRAWSRAEATCFSCRAWAVMAKARASGRCASRQTTSCALSSRHGRRNQIQQRFRLSHQSAQVEIRRSGQRSHEVPLNSRTHPLCVIPPTLLTFLLPCALFRCEHVVYVLLQLARASGRA